MSSSESAPAAWEIMWRICDIAADVSGHLRETVSPESRLIEDLDIDSLALVELVMTLEDEFGIAVPDNAPRNAFVGPLRTIADVSQLVLEYLETGRATRPSPREFTERAIEFLPFTQTPTSQSPLYEPIGPNREGFRLYRRRTDGMRCVLVPACRMAIGAHYDQTSPNQKPRSSIYLSAYLIDAEPVSNIAFSHFLNSIEGDIEPFYGVDADDPRLTNLALTKKKGVFQCAKGMETHPVVMVSWFGANAYSLWANELDWKDPESSMLPTEAQWENAAQDTTEGWTAQHRRGKTYSAQIPTQPVNALLGVSRYGLTHMSGNVWQWCRDWYSPDFSDRMDTPDPVCLENTGIRSERGGSWVGPPEIARITYRRGRPPTAKGRCLGFRCVGIFTEREDRVATNDFRPESP